MNNPKQVRLLDIESILGLDRDAEYQSRKTQMSIDRIDDLMDESDKKHGVPFSYPTKASLEKAGCEF